MDEQRQDDQLELTYNTSVPIQDIILKTSLEKWTIETSGEMLCFDLRSGPRMLFQDDAPEGSDTFQWPVIERDRVGGLRLIIWDKVKVPRCHYRVMHRKRVTCELHDSYFRLMTIKHSISKIQWALNYYLTQLSSGARAVASRIPDS